MEKISRLPCVVGNWKMHGSKKKVSEWMNSLNTQLNSPEFASVSTALSEKNLDLVICPPSPYLQQVQELIEANSNHNHPHYSVGLGAQNVYCTGEGAYTGEIAVSMLSDFFCRYVIIGHSERRQLMGETSALIARKFVAAYHAGLIPILCVGEMLADRKAGRTMDVINSQLRPVLDSVALEAFERAIIAYEPVWAIGTGVSASPEEAQTVHASIRSMLSSLNADKGQQVASRARILYGGSIKSETAGDLFKQPDIDGGLVGGASLNPQEFLLICKAAVS